VKLKGRVIYGVRNPGSTLPSDGFSNIVVLSSSGWVVAEMQGSTGNITTTSAGVLKESQLIQDSLLPKDNTTYTIQFTPLN
jgi:hypothetical protein